MPSTQPIAADFWEVSQLVTEIRDIPTLLFGNVFTVAARFLRIIRAHVSDVSASASAVRSFVIVYQYGAYEPIPDLPPSNPTATLNPTRELYRVQYVAVNAWGGLGMAGHIE